MFNECKVLWVGSRKEANKQNVSRKLDSAVRDIDYEGGRRRIPREGKVLFNDSLHVEVRKEN